jgi:cyclic pyranopterin phosphate synthase
MPEQGVDRKSHHEIIRYEEIEQIVRIAVKLGIDKIRLTGGEPLVRRNIEDLVGMISAVKGINELVMTTNGILLAEKAAALKENGLDRVNISLDTLDPQRYNAFTRGGDVKAVLKGIDSALAARLTPIKINMVIGEGTPTQEVTAMQDFCKSEGLVLQRINHFSLRYRKDVSGKYQAERPTDCTRCNRIRLTADKKLLPCLFSNKKVDVDFENLEGCLRRVIEEKPEYGTACSRGAMISVGG